MSPIAENREPLNASIRVEEDWYSVCIVRSYLFWRGGKFSPRLLIAADEEEEIKTVSFRNRRLKRGRPVEISGERFKVISKKARVPLILPSSWSIRERKKREREIEKRYFYLAFLTAINTEKAKGIISQQATRVLIHGVPRQRDSSFFDHVIFFISGLQDFAFPSSFLFLKTSIRFLTIQYDFFLAKFSRGKRQGKISPRLLKFHNVERLKIFSIFIIS